MTCGPDLAHHVISFSPVVGRGRVVGGEGGDGSGLGGGSGSGWAEVGGEGW